MSRLYRWGIIGAGNIANKFASALNYTEGAELLGIASRDADKAKLFAAKYGATHVYDQYLSLAEDPEIDIIYIATPHAFHCEQAIFCLERNKAVLCEKPMALNLQQVSRMINLARSNQTFLMEGMWTRFMPAICKMLELVNEDAIGAVQYVRADFGFNAPFDPQKRLYNIKLGGGSLLDVGIYPVYLASFLLGEPTSIQSLSKLSVTGVDEYCNIQFQYEGGQTAQIFSSITIKTSLTAEIAGTKGRILLHCPFYKASKITLEDNDFNAESFSFPHEHNGFEYEIRHVMQCLDKGYTESALIPHALSLKVHRIMDTVREQCGIVYV